MSAGLIDDGIRLPSRNNTYSTAFPANCVFVESVQPVRSNHTIPRPFRATVTGMAANFRYEPLVGSYSTRVITLLPSASREDRIEVCIAEVDLETPPPYEALSYSWGDPSQRVALQCHGKDLHVTPNCESALRHLRRDSGVRTLWVDAICIDQTSTDDRNQQVRIMGDVYSKASLVLIWLGPATSVEPSLFRFLRVFEGIRSMDQETQTLLSSQLYGALQGNGPSQRPSSA
jgi:hypothetical protein